jgi:hypothetical protein
MIPIAKGAAKHSGLMLTLQKRNRLRSNFHLKKCMDTYRAESQVVVVRVSRGLASQANADLHSQGQVRVVNLGDHGGGAALARRSLRRGSPPTRSSGSCRISISSGRLLLDLLGLLGTGRLRPLLLTARVVLPGEVNTAILPLLGLVLVSLPRLLILNHLLAVWVNQRRGESFQILSDAETAPPTTQSFAVGTPLLNVIDDCVDYVWVLVLNTVSPRQRTLTGAHQSQHAIPYVVTTLLEVGAVFQLVGDVIFPRW